MVDPFQIVRDFEIAVADYTGAFECVAVNSCTSALFLALRYWKETHGCARIECPKRTYISVPMQILHAGHELKFIDLKWEGEYQLQPTHIWDSARRFQQGMCKGAENYIICTSHHWNKPLGIQQGGCILTDDDLAYDWFRKARFDGRTEGVAPKDDKVDSLGWHMYMSPEIAAAGLVRLHHLGKGSVLPNDAYPDLSKLPVFKGRTVK